MENKQLEKIENVANYERMAKIFVWVNSDLDGATSTILLGRVFPKMEYRHCFFGDFQNQYLEWSEKYFDEYEKIFIVGMVLDQEFLKKIDDKKIVIISDRGDKLKVWDTTLISEEYSSCSKLIYKIFSKKINFSRPIKYLTLFVDDYNSYNLKFTHSQYLNGVYRTMPYDRFGSFVKRFWDGYDGFTDKELERAESFFQEIEDEVAQLDLYEGESGGYKILATISKKSVNELAKNLIDNHDHDVIIVLNPSTKFVSFRKHPKSGANIALLAEKLVNGGGGEWAAGGQYTEKFGDFMKGLLLL